MSWFARLFRRSELYQDLAEEMRAHLEEKTEQFMREGMSREEAAQAARRAFGNATVIEERGREVWQRPRVESIWADVKYAARQLRRSPGFTVTAVLTLALGVGANTAVFSVLNAVLFRPLPFDSPDRLVSIFSVENGRPIGPSPLDMRDFSRQNRTFENLAVFDTWRKNVVTSQTGGGPESQKVGLASTEFFEVLRIRPVLGRIFLPEEGDAGRNHVALITEAFWRSHYARDAGILGRKITINDVPYSIVGVLPNTIPDWIRQGRVQIWEPFLPVPDTWDEQGRGGRDSGAIGRLRPGVTLQQAQADLATIAASLGATYPADHGVGVSLEPLIRSRSGDLRPALLLLMGAVTLILLIACSNLAALLLARNTVRQREFGMRAALGAGRARLIQQILVETVLLSVLGGGWGMVIAWVCEAILRQKHPARIPQLGELTLDWRVLMFTCVAVVGTSLLFGLAPALLNTRINFADTLKEGGRSSNAPARQAFRKSLVVAQLALSLMLMVGAGLLVQSIVRLEEQDLGFRADHLVKAHFYLPPVEYGSPEAITRFCDSYTERVRALPGVKDVSITTIYPPQDRWSMRFSIDGRPVSRMEDIPWARFGVVDANYLRTTRISVLEGRDFAESDSEKAPVAAIVNQAFVHRFLSEEDPIGRRIEMGTPANLSAPDPWLDTRHIEATIVGVMRDTKNQGLATPTEPMFITLFRQTPPVNYGFKDVLVRSDIAPGVLIDELTRQLHELDPQLPLSEAETMTEYIETYTSGQRFTTTLLSAFAALGLVLAIVGVYGVVSYLVAQRHLEIGIRLALGAPRRDVLWLIVRQGVVLALLGAGLGLAGMMILSHSMSSFLYGISALDLGTLCATSALLILIAILASAIPGRRATRIDPIEALRAE